MKANSMLLLQYQVLSAWQGKRQASWKKRPPGSAKISDRNLQFFRITALAAKELNRN